MSETESSFDFEQSMEIDQSIQSIEESFHQSVHEPASHQALKETFKRLDRDGKGFVSKSVLRGAVMVTGEQYDKGIIKQEIENCDDKIVYSRFIEIFNRASLSNQGLHSWIFGLYDRDSKGFIDIEDLQRASEITGIELDEQQMHNMLLTERNEGTGQVDFEDFVYIMEEDIQYM